jgi:tRNA U34 5-carboxymethylaminomethyl modifying enzyme MnmG/GidA
MKEKKNFLIAGSIFFATIGSFVLGRITKKVPDPEKLLKAEAENKVLCRELKRAQMRAESLAHSLGKVTQQLYEKEEE